MTWVAQLHALVQRQWLDVRGPVSAEAVCQEMGIPIFPYPFRGGILGAYSHGAIAVRPHLHPRVRDDVILHEVGHHLIDGPEADLHFWRRRDWVMLSKSERRAEQFAHFFALPGDELLALIGGDVPIWDIAEQYSRTPQWVCERVQLGWFAGELEPLRRQDWVA